MVERGTEVVEHITGDRRHDRVDRRDVGYSVDEQGRVFIGRCPDDRVRRHDVELADCGAQLLHMTLRPVQLDSHSVQTRQHETKFASVWDEEGDGDLLVTIGGPSTIARLAPAGEQPVYDVEMADEMHCFVANGIVTHNSHTAAYGVTTWRTAWLKANHPLAFGAALMTEHGPVKRVSAMVDLRSRGFKILPPLVNSAELSASYLPASAESEGAVVIGLDGIRNVGAFASRIIAERRANGAYKDLNDLWQRLAKPADNSSALAIIAAAGLDLPEDFELEEATAHQLKELGLNSLDTETVLTLVEATRGINNKIVTSLIAAGALDDFGPRFGMTMVSALGKTGSISAVPSIEWGTLEKLERERALLGAYITGNPITYAAADIKRFIKNSVVLSVEQAYEQVMADPSLTKFAVPICGVVTDIKESVSKKGFPKLDFILQGEERSMEASVSWSAIPGFGDMRPGSVVVVYGEVEVFRREAEEPAIVLNDEGEEVHAATDAAPSEPKMFFRAFNGKHHGATVVPVTADAPDLSSINRRMLVAGAVKSARGGWKNGKYAPSKTAAALDDDMAMAIDELDAMFGGLPQGMKLSGCPSCGGFGVVATSPKKCSWMSGCTGIPVTASKLSLKGTPVEALFTQFATPSADPRQKAAFKPPSENAIARLKRRNALPITKAGDVRVGVFGGPALDVVHGLDTTSFAMTRASANVRVEFAGPKVQLLDGDIVAVTGRKIDGSWTFTDLQVIERANDDAVANAKSRKRLVAA